VTIENLTSEAYEEDDFSGIPELVEAIKLQDSGPAEAARAIRKKLKYGSAHRQLRALTLMDGLIQNAGSRFQRTFIDEPLLERLRFCATADLSDPDVKKKCSELFRGWAIEYQNTPGLERIAKLNKVSRRPSPAYLQTMSHMYKQLPRRKQVVTQERSKVLKETENPFGDEDDEPSSPPASSSQSGPGHSRNTSLSGPQVTGQIQSYSVITKDKDRKKKDKKRKKLKPVDIEAERDQMKVTIADSSMAATDLINALQSINRERERISENQVAVQRFEACKQLRRKVLRYVSSPGLVH